MRKRIYYTVLFLSGLIVLDRAIGVTFYHLYDQTSAGEFGGQINAALDRRHDDVIIFGSSLARHHVNDRQLADDLGVSAFNVGANGHGIYYARMLQSLMLRRGCEAKLFVFVLNPGDLFSDELERCQMFSLFAEEDPVVAELLARGSLLTRLKQLSWTYRFNSIAVPMFAQIALFGESTGSGFVPLRGLWTPDADRVAVRERDFARLTDQQKQDRFRFAQQKLDVYRDFIRAARENGTQVVFVTSPTCRDHSEYIEQERRLGLDVFADLAAAENVPFLVNDETLVAQFSDIDWFHDEVHLNRTGAECFTAELGAKLANPATSSDIVPASAPSPAIHRFATGPQSPVR